MKPNLKQYIIVTGPLMKKRGGGVKGGFGPPPPPPTFPEIELRRECFLANSLLCHSPRHLKLFWPRHSQILNEGSGSGSTWGKLNMADLRISVINLFTIPYTNQDLIFRNISHTMVGEHFQIYRVQIIGKCICETLPGDDMIINPSCSTTPPNHLINLLKKCLRGGHYWKWYAQKIPVSL